MRTRQAVELPEPVLIVRGDFGEGLAELVTRKLAAVARHVHEPVLAIRVELYRHHDPAVAVPVAAKANVDVNGRRLHAAATGRTARDAVGKMVDRLTRQMDDRPHARRRGPTPTNALKNPSRAGNHAPSPPRPRRGERPCVPETS
jgi:ribosome-associated translation inhibitor RaiA